MSPVPSNETYYRRYLDDPLASGTQYDKPIPAPSITAQVQIETTQSSASLHASFDAANKQINQQLRQGLNVNA